MAVKQVIVIRKDLKMRRGKEIAQGSHASIAFLTRQIQNDPGAIELSQESHEWIENGFTKVCLQVDSEQELLEVFRNAQLARLEVHLVKDSGRTEFNGVPTYTCLAIGPAKAEDIDNVTGHLKLY